MKTRSLTALALLSALMIAGCSSAPETKTESSASEPVSSVEESKESKTETSAASLEDISMAFSNAGYSVSDVVTEGDKTTFTAENDNGSFQVEGQNFENETEASQTYETSASQLEDDGYLEVESYDADQKQTRVLLNDYNTVYGVAAINREAKSVVTLQDIPEPALDGAKSVLEMLGYPVE